MLNVTPIAKPSSDDCAADHVTTVAHEMRTPLTAMKASLALLMERKGMPSDDATRQLLTICERNTERLLKLVNDLLELSRVESTPAPSTGPVALAEVARETVASLSALAEQQRVLITAYVPTHLRVAAEAEGIRRILVNLIGNAIKFTPGGHVDVSAEERRGVVHLRVCDNGMGIPQHLLEGLFDRYHSMRKSAVQEGTGLGLAITKAIVTRIGGHITVQSKVSRGTCFTVTLPVAKPTYTRQRTVFRRPTANYGRFTEELAHG